MQYRSFNDRSLQQEYDKEIIRELARDDTKKYIESLSKDKKAGRELYKSIGVAFFVLVTLYILCYFLGPYL